jgi:hypothetical protein
MARLVLILLFVAALAIAAHAVLGLWRSLNQPSPIPAGPREDPMPDAIRNVAYVLLLILLIGVASGWLGA